MTKLQAWISALLVFFAGVGLLLVGVFVKEPILVGLGPGVMLSGLTALGLPRPADVPSTTTIPTPPMQ